MSAVFVSTINQMLTLVLFLGVGYLLARKHLLADHADAVLAKLETYVLLPAVVINAFASQCTVTALHENANLILVGALSIGAAIVLSYPLSVLFTRTGGPRNVYRYSFAFANTGYVGNVVIASVFGEKMLFYFLMFSIPATFACYTWGILTLTAEHGQKFHIRQLLQPIILALPVGIALGLSGIALPAFVNNAVKSATACLGPIGMLLTGMVIAQFHWSDLLGDWKIYVAALIRLVALPVAFVLVARAAGVSEIAAFCVLSTVCMPFGLNSVVFPAAYGGDARPGAGMVIVSHLLSVVTIPILFSIFAK